MIRRLDGGTVGRAACTMNCWRVGLVIVVVIVNGSPRFQWRCLWYSIRVKLISDGIRRNDGVSKRGTIRINVVFGAIDGLDDDFVSWTATDA